MPDTFLQALEAGPLVADGAMGTALRELLGHPEDDANLELLNLNAPDLVRKIHESYVAAGADILQTNTYGANLLQFTRLGQPELVERVNSEAVALARRVAIQADRHIWVAGSVGPLGVLRYDFDLIRTDAIAATYARQMAALTAAG